MRRFLRWASTPRLSYSEAIGLAIATVFCVRGHTVIWLSIIVFGAIAQVTLDAWNRRTSEARDDG